MAARQPAPPSGLTIGQVFTLSFGFILASVLIFALGWWVGYDAAQQRRERDRQPVRVPVVPLQQMPAPAATAPPAAAVTATATMTHKAVPATPTDTPQVLIRTMTPSRAPTRAPTVPVAKSGSGTFSVQVKATTEALEAVMFARQLRQKGYDAFTVQAPIGSVTWYRVRVGRFADRASARATEQRLREQEKIEAAYVVND